MSKIINPNNMTKNEAESLINFVSRVSLGEDVNLGQFFKPINDYQKGWNDAMEASNSQVNIALRGNNLDVDGEYPTKKCSALVAMDGSITRLVMSFVQDWTKTLLKRRPGSRFAPSV